MIKKSDCAKVTENIVDEQGTFRIKGTNDSDHNALLLSFETAIEKSTKVIRRWKLNNKKGWETLNHNMSQINTRQISDYDKFESTVRQLLINTRGKEKIRIGGKNKKEENEEIKNLGKERKKLRKKEAKAIKDADPQKREHIQAYLNIQMTIRKKMEEAEREEIRAITKKIINVRGTKSKTLWKAK